MSGLPSRPVKPGFARPRRSRSPDDFRRVNRYDDRDRYHDRGIPSRGSYVDERYAARDGREVPQDARYRRSSRSRSPMRSAQKPIDPYEDEERIPAPRKYDHDTYQPERPTRKETPVAGMTSDMFSETASKPLAQAEPRWERGHDIAEFEQSYGYGGPPQSNQHLLSATGPNPYAQHQYSQAQPAGYEASYQGGETEGAHDHGRPPSEPARDVIFLGLDLNLEEEIILTYFRAEPFNLALDSFTIVRDRTTGQSRGFGFALFASVASASEFVYKYGPHLQVPPLCPGCLPMSLKIDFSAGNSSSSRDYERGRNDGVRDIGPPGNGNRVLFIRGLDSETSQEDLRDRLGAEIVRLAGASSVASKAPIMDGRPAIMRVVLIRHRNSKSSCGLAFVELASTELASALLAHLLSRIAQPVGFVVRSRPVACSFANPEAFVEAGEEGKPPAQTNWLIHGTSTGGLGNTTNWVKHRDDWLGASEIKVGGDLEENLKSYLQSLIVPNEDAMARSRGKKEIAETAAPALLDRSAGGIKLQPLKAGFTKKKEREDVMVPLSVNGAPIANAIAISGSPANVLGETEDDDELTALPSKSYPGRSKHVVPALGSHKKMASNISKWQTRQGELKADLAQNQAKASGNTISNAGVNATPVGFRRTVASASAPSPSVSPGPEDFDYRDVAKMACLLCQRQFKSLDILGRHCNASELHKKNLADPAICEAGKGRYASIAHPAATIEVPAGPSYRDRAAERRQVFNQPSMPLPEEVRTAPARKFARAPTPPPPPPVPGPAPGEDHTNKGNQLLKKMGWTEGSGLGLGGEGRKAPVETLLFAEKAGIGASKGKDATQTAGVLGYTQYAKANTFDRYAQAK